MLLRIIWTTPVVCTKSFLDIGLYIYTHPHTRTYIHKMIIEIFRNSLPLVVHLILGNIVTEIGIELVGIDNWLNTYLRHRGVNINGHLCPLVVFYRLIVNTISQFYRRSLRKDFACRLNHIKGISKSLQVAAIWTQVK